MPNNKDVPSSCQVSLYNRQRELPLSIDCDLLSKFVNVVLSCEKESAIYLELHFVSDRLLRKYHKEYFNDSSSTDCISFPMDSSTTSSGRVLGDVLICPKTALNYVQADHSLFWKEFSLYIVHGILHLLGYEDTTSKKKAQMRRRERIILSKLESENLLVFGKLL